MTTSPPSPARPVEVGALRLDGLLSVPAGAIGVVAFVHGSGSDRLSPRNARVAAALHARALGTLRFDLLSEAEAADRANVFDVPLLGERVVEALWWLRSEPSARGLPIGLFGASTGAAAALVAAAACPRAVGAVVSRGGRPDLAAAALARVDAPTLLIVGGEDDVVLGLNRRALGELRCEAALEVVPGATHLFEQAGALEQVTAASGDWFVRHLGAA